MSSIPSSMASYPRSLVANLPPEPEEIAFTIAVLGLEKHLEGGYFKRTDCNTTKIPIPSLSTRRERNEGRTIHTLHWGRGCYVIIHPDEHGAVPGSKARMETFVVGQDIGQGEKLQWIVEGGKYKASFLLPDKGRDESSGGLLISETVTPGFEFSDHEFLTADTLKELVSSEQSEDLSWMLRQSEG